MDQPDELASCRMIDFALPPTQGQGADAGVDQGA